MAARASSRRWASTITRPIARGPNGDIVLWTVADEPNDTGVDVGCGEPGTRQSLARLTRDGICVWTHPVLTSPPMPQGNQPPLDGFIVEGLATDPLGNIVLTGQFLDFVDFGNGRLDSAPNEDKEVIAAFAPDGAVRWTHAFGGRINLENPRVGYPACPGRTSSITLPYGSRRGDRRARS